MSYDTLYELQCDCDMLSSYRELYYSKMYNLDRGIHAHKASNTPPTDERFNFGKSGSAQAYRPKIFPASTYPE